MSGEDELYYIPIMPTSFFGNGQCDEWIHLRLLQFFLSSSAVGIAFWSDKNCWKSMAGSHLRWFPSFPGCRFDFFVRVDHWISAQWLFYFLVWVICIYVYIQYVFGCVFWTIPQIFVDQVVDVSLDPLHAVHHENNPSIHPSRQEEKIIDSDGFITREPRPDLRWCGP